MTLPLQSAPESICVLRLSAVGDICHTLPVIRTLQAAWPDTHITWVIGKLEHTLIGDIPGIDFVIFDKSDGISAYRNLHKHMQGKHYDVLLHMQMSLRASMASLLISADIRLGFDRQRAKDMQWLFTNNKIRFKPEQHVVDSLFGFSEALGIGQHQLQWDIPVAESIRQSIQKKLPQSPYIVISPCSSMAYRNWSAEGYTRVIEYIVNKLGRHVILTGGPSQTEADYADQIAQHCQVSYLDLIGKTSLKELLVILEQAELLIAPDSGPAHMATAVATPVIGLYACTNPDRARPYLSPELVVNRYDEAIQEKYGKPVKEMAWGTRIKDEGTMARIKTEEVITMLQKFYHTVTNPIT